MTTHDTTSREGPIVFLPFAGPPAHVVHIPMAPDLDLPWPKDRAERAAQSKAFYAGLGHRLRVARLALGLSEQDAAACEGVPVATWRRWEQGHKPRSPAMVRFADEHKVSLNWLLGRNGTGLDPRLVHTSGTLAILPMSNPHHREVCAHRQAVYARGAAGLAATW